MVIMALDHSHDFFGNFAANPTDLATTTVGLFFTRWITHICAPTFFLLTGTGAFLTLDRMSKGALARYLVSRGLWLIFLELVVMRFALQFNFDYQVTIVTVLWALGWAMIVLAALIWLPLWAIGAFGAVLVVGHDALDRVQAASFGALRPLWLLLHEPGVVYNNGHSLVLVSYVLIPWVGVTALGYVLGRTFGWEAAARVRLLSWLGVGLIAGFIILRLVNGYGDPGAWSQQKTLLWTVLSFLNTSKYPPSLLYLMMTLGPALMLLAAFEHARGVWARVLATFGQVPFFFYVVHIYLIHTLAKAAGSTAILPKIGIGLPGIYLIWLLVLVLLYPICRWFAGLKQCGRRWWWSYL